MIFYDTSAIAPAPRPQYPYLDSSNFTKIHGWRRYDSVYDNPRGCLGPRIPTCPCSITSRFPGMALTYFLNNFKMDPVAPINTGITLEFTFHIRCISIVRYFYYYYYITSVGLTPGGSSTVQYSTVQYCTVK
jgi:hypothetical protein